VIRKLPRYVLFELLSALLLALVLILLLLIAGLSLKLVYTGLPPTQLLRLIPYLTLFALPHALPAALLTAAVMTYGRLAGDNEITAVRSSGIHLHVVVLPGVFAGLVATMIGLQLNCNMLPRAYFRIERLKFSAGQALALSRIKADGELAVPPFLLRADSVENQKMLGVTILEYEGKDVRQMWSAREAEITTNEETGSLAVVLRGGQIRTLGSRHEKMEVIDFSTFTFDIPNPRADQKEPTKAKHMDMAQLLKHRSKQVTGLRRAKKVFDDPKRAEKAAHREVSKIDVDYNIMIAQARQLQSQVKADEGQITASQSKKEAARLEATRARQRTSTARAARDKARRQFKGLDPLLNAENQKKRAELREEIKKQDGVIEKAEMLAEEAQSDATRAAAEIAASKKRLVEIRAQQKVLAAKMTEVSQQRKEVDARRQGALMQLEMIEIDAEIHQRLSTAFSCLTFVLVGIPLGIMAKRGNILVGFAISSMVVLLIYYPLVLGGQVLIFDKYLPITPSTWAANGVLAAFGIALLTRTFRQ